MGLSQVIARIEGGLGNQLFQYATARSLADRLGFELMLDLRGLAENADRPYQLDYYQVRASIADDSLLKQLPHWRSSRSGRLKSRFSQRFPWLYSYPNFWPNSFAFDPRFEHIARSVFLVGYWQSEKYFFWNRERLLRDITLLQPLALDSPQIKQMHATSSVALHIRRGDYVSNPAAAAMHGVCDLRYYESAVALLQQSLKDAEVFVFSDDLQWARDHLKFGLSTHFVESAGADSGIQDLALMSHCKHHVIANSSFSWWGAWLSVNPEQQVIAPRRWFQDAGVDTSDVIPARWHVLE